MQLLDWKDLPSELQKESIRPYYDYLNRKRGSLLLKRVFDILLSCVLLVILAPIMIIVAIIIKLDSKGPVLFLQKRKTRYFKDFYIFKFRTMVVDADKIGSSITTFSDPRITRVGSLIRKTRIDEIPQLINILLGQMSFVGTRPEVEKYVDTYSDEMKATLLMKAGVTSLASIHFRNEQDLLQGVENIDQRYVEEILPLKMKYNLEYLKNFSILGDLKLLVKTVISVFR